MGGPQARLVHVLVHVHVHVNVHVLGGGDHRGETGASWATGTGEALANSVEEV